jgi:hypothetical protein
MQSNQQGQGLSNNVGAQLALMTIGLIAVVVIAWFYVFWPRKGPGRIRCSPGLLACFQRGAPTVPRIHELFELAKQCYAQANGTLNPRAKETLQDKGDQYMQKADTLRRSEIIQAVFPNDKKAG